jgi:tetratricopeptide (TPR) repeat protein
MASPCDNIDLFVDGELSPEEAETFRQHLPDCARCQQQFSNLLQLKLLEKRHVDRDSAQELPEPTGFAPSMHWKRPALLGAGLLAVVLLAVLAVRQFSPPPLQHDVFLAKRPQRPLDVRLCVPGADLHRPPAAKPMALEEVSEELPLKALAELQEAQDFKALVAAYLVHGVPDLAAKYLEKLDDSPNSQSLRAATLLLQGKHEEALRHTTQALEKDPRHPQALWNRGLALEAMDLPLMAARSFNEVASMKEPGWADEATQRATHLQQTASKRRERWDRVFKAGKALVEFGPTGLPEDFTQTPIARLFFYDAVRAAPSRERALALLPLASELDARAGGHILQDYVREVAARDFNRRGPLSRDYAALALGRLSKEQAERFLTELLSSNEDDLILGAIVHTRTVARHRKRFEDMANSLGDPWFELLASEKIANIDKDDGHFGRATQTLLDALRLCPKPGLEYRCIFLERELSTLYIKREQLNPARQHAEDGWQWARQHNEWSLERDLLWNLAQVARYKNDAPLARALYEELHERARKDPDMVRRAHQNFAEIALHELQVDEARREMDAALATGIPLSFSGAFALADLSRLRKGDRDEEHLKRALEAAASGLTRGQRVIATHIRGRFYIERDPQQGRDLLWSAIHEAEAPPLADDPEARRGRAYSFTSLIFDAGRRGVIDEALTLFARERGQEDLPGQCLLAVATDSERTLLIVRSARGELLGHHDETRRQPLGERLDGLVPDDLLDSLRPCPQVSVLARPPLHGRAGLLPPEFAWSYLTRTSAPRTPPPGPSRRLVVSGVKQPHGTPGELLNVWTPEFGSQEIPTLLSGAEATPSRVMKAMEDKTEIDLVTHGVINDSSDDSYLQLAPDENGSRLGVQQVREVSLQGAPFVVLAACYAASTAYTLQEPLSLPAAFISRGARGVLAATTKIWDLEAGDFFNEVRARMREGVPPAVALRDVRVKWIAADRGTKWVDSVLLFE